MRTDLPDEQNGASVVNQPPSKPATAESHVDAIIPESLSPSIARTERFVGDLNPEAVIREKLDVTVENKFRDRIGLWISSSSAENNEKNRIYCSNVGISSLDRLPAAGSQTVESMLYYRHVSASKAYERLPLSTRDQLIPVYLSKVNHILPLVDKDSFLLAHSEGTASVFLEKAICLVAAKDRVVAPYLRLAVDGPLMSSRHFCSEIYKALVVVINEGLEPDRVTRIRVLALMSLHCEGYEGAESASMHHFQAIHQAQTVGLHLDRPGRVPGDTLPDLFWCLWTLDKMHASIGGRPVLLADRDIGLEKPDIKSTHSRTAFQIWPAADHTVGWEGDFPSFEEIIGDNVQQDLDFATLVPYALALSMGVSYQQLRSSKLITHFDRAKASLEACCSLLEEVGFYWYSAEAMARLGQKALHQIREVRRGHPRHSRDSRPSRAPQNVPFVSRRSEEPASCLSSQLHQNHNPPLSYVPSLEPIPGPVSPDPLDSDNGGILAAVSSGFADIDMLVGDFLDPSLPTNFWDPVFFSGDYTGT
ncbi:transcription factor domain-containing protein [Aspergillus tanneri]|uniref:Xylanolytic transcriptional activator regulatory domain-containing protein n=1 Tax=Aspergillus tanneri TaxID=1220188 RepID=A0A5M9MXC9_9EURO|nr:uncharacterized protein ATNIH1004_002690 [Aspergillus tanneri]KAA8650010.1 hypothetical protein ATNIH1004_002690 [Aspergillus tanneri]